MGREEVGGGEGVGMSEREKRFRNLKKKERAEFQAIFWSHLFEETFTMFIKNLFVSLTRRL